MDYAGHHKKAPGLVQTIKFDKSMYTKAQVISWLKKHGLKHDVVLEDNYYHARQRPPKKDRRYYSKEITDGVIFVFYEDGPTKF